jgi:hypothetical protein
VALVASAAIGAVFGAVAGWWGILLVAAALSLLLKAADL